MDNPFRERFRNASAQELVDALNGEAGKAGWTSARGSYLAVLHEAFVASGLDCSQFIVAGQMRLRRVKLDGERVVLVDSPAIHSPESAVEMEQKALTAFHDSPFSAVFHLPRGPETTRWRIRNSGVTGPPSRSAETSAVLSACEVLGVKVRQTSSGSAANASSYKVAATFLDGGIEGETGNYWMGERGVWVTGANAVLALALQIGLKVGRRWYETHGLTGVSLAELRTKIQG